VRILQWLNSYLPDTGGIQTFCADLLPELTNRGHEVLILTSHVQKGIPDRTTVGGIDVCRVHSVEPLMEQDPGGILRAQRAIASIINDFDPDLLHIHPCGPELPYYLRVQQKRPTPTVMTLHNNYSDMTVDFGPTSFFGRTLDHARQIAAVSEDACRWLLSERPDLEAKTEPLHNGIPDHARGAGAPLPWDPPMLTFIGRVAPQKRLDILIKAFAIVAERHPTVRLQVAGDGAELPDIRSLADSLDLGDRIDFLGLISPEAVPDLLDTTTLFVMSSDYEGLPIALLEAARQARPTVSTDVGGVREVVLHGETGLLTERDNPALLAEAIIELLEDPARAAQFGAAARDHFGASFDLSSCASSYERLYQQATGSAQ